MSNTTSGKAPVLSEDRKRELLLFQKENGLSFSDISLLDNAFIHSSFANEVRNPQIKDYERLEFLGDSILSVAVSEYLYAHLEGDEGDCSWVRSLVVSEDSLSEIARSLKLDRYLLMGKGEELSGGRNKKAILADCTEALIAAIFLDKGFEEARAFVQKIIIPEIGKAIEKRNHKDFKTRLQEYVQKRWRKVPAYQMVGCTGPEHDQVFTYTVTVNGKTFGPAEGHNKKDAEQNAARLALESLDLL